MKTAFGGLLVCVGALLACRNSYEPPEWQRIGNETYAVNCIHAAVCYERAATVCPFGFQNIGQSTEAGAARATSTRIGNNVFTNVTTEDGWTQAIITCRPPTFCKDQAGCPFGTKCEWTSRYPGHAACAIR